MGLYENIKNAAKMRNISVNQMEKDLSLPRSSIAKYNASMPSADKILNIANYLGVSVESIMTGDPSAQAESENPALEEKAIELFNLYEKASPEVQKAVEILLKSAQ